MAATHTEPHPDAWLARAHRRTCRRADHRQERRVDLRRGLCRTTDWRCDDRGSPRRTGRALARRTLRHIGPHACGDDHRTGADHLAHASQRAKPDAAARHGACGRDAGAEWTCWHLHRRGHAAAPRAGVPDARRERVPRCADADGDPCPGAAQLHAHYARPLLLDRQLIFVGSTCLALYLVFLFVQTVRHQDYFVPAGVAEDEHAEAPSARIGAISGGLLVLSLVAVVLLAKLLAPFIERRHRGGRRADQAGWRDCCGDRAVAGMCSPPCARRGATNCRPASTWPWAARWPASGSLCQP